MEFPVEISEIHEGERIRKPEMRLEFGGLNVDKKFEVALVQPPGQVEDGKITIVGPDLPQLEEGRSYRLGILIEVAGEKVEKDLEGVLERRTHYFLNYIEGVMHLNQRSDIWIRISKKAYAKGLNSLNWIGRALIMLFKKTFPIIEKIQVTFFTDPEKVEEFYPKALDTYAARDAKARGMMEEDVDEFYGCLMCQSFAPSHVCIITPNRMGGCGSISWFDARAAYRIDPKGPNFPVPKGQCLDPVKGAYEGVTKTVNERSLGAIQDVWLHTLFHHPHTSCGCFEAIAFYIPEVDGIGVVHREFKGSAVNGLSFSTLAGHTSGGVQNEGFLGIAIEYLRSKKFLKADGGWERVVWLPSQIKERILDAIPEDLRSRIATEKEAGNIEELKVFLQKVDHPVVQRWKAPEKPAAEVEVEAGLEAAPMETVPLPSEAYLTAVSPTGGGFRIILKNAKIIAEKVIIKREEKK
ncbi:CO dehydrogenase/CO-methylating acetyl-CoA synthase complex subunit beta [Candidatus Hecatella orcuttiae]|jgi:acetyl-CoA decarbonylase/synthase complex subunit beta|uniref:CO dehydrogenase/CO-methylating acetyl-CoA synthase complex subunit beta n=1 Tax=Candidatus Hecatella orcuttiae TaxID=1935119 RepID=UPI002867F12B|nr:CO dehydrogenase/CO-methylating acetyl-CoA synthase complex subunit beta [Candidatus Hecatella orcuttiae]